MLGPPERALKDKNEALIVDPTPMSSSPIQGGSFEPNPMFNIDRNVNCTLLNGSIPSLAMNSSSSSPNTANISTQPPSAQYQRSAFHIGSSSQETVKVAPSATDELHVGIDASATVPFSTNGVPTIAPQSPEMVDMDVQSGLKDRIAVLEMLISDLDGQDFPAYHQTLLGRVMNEIETWVEEGQDEAMQYDAQLALLYTIGRPTANSEQYGFDTPEKQALQSYLSILQSAYSDGRFSNDERDTLWNAISDCEDASNVTNGSDAEPDYLDQLNILHRIFDDYIARHSIEMAIQLVKRIRMDNSLQALRMLRTLRTDLDINPIYERAVEAIGRFEQLDEVKDLEDAIAGFREVVQLASPDSPNWPRYLRTLGIVHHIRFKRLGEMEDLDAAIGRLGEAVDLTPRTGPERPERLSRLGVLHRIRFKRLGEVKDIDAAIRRHSEAVDLTPLDSPDRPEQLEKLARSFRTRFKWFKEPKDRKDAIDAFRRSSMSEIGNPTVRMRDSLKYGAFHHRHEEYSLASEGYLRAVELLPEIAWVGLDAMSQLSRLTSKTEAKFKAFGCDAAACMFSLAESDRDNEQQHLGRAVELLDPTRSIVWSQASNLIQDQELEDLKKVNAQLAKEIDEVGRTLRMNGFRDPNIKLSKEEEQIYRDLTGKWKNLIFSARKLPGFAHFCRPPPMSSLREAANGGPVIVINISKFRSDVLIIPPNGNLELLPLSPETATRAKALAEIQQHIMGSQGLRKSDRMMEIQGKRNKSLLDVLHETWTLLGGPIIQKLEECGILGSGAFSTSRVWWLLTDQLAFLPIHACLPPPTEDGIQPIGMTDLVVSSYTPTLSMLARAVRPGTARPFRMLAVGQSISGSLPPLSCVNDEMQVIRTLLPHDATILEGSEASVDNVSAALPECTWAHFACHGVQNHDQPLESGLSLRDGRLLTLSHIARSSLERAEFAFLSSCESATGSKLAPSESVHLAAGLQFLGFRSVIGTMWSVDDEDALFVAKTVYEQLFKNGSDNVTSSEAAHALYIAVQRLRDEKKVSPARWVPFIHFGV